MSEGTAPIIKHLNKYYVLFAKGKNGKSVYDLWIEAGNEGTLDDFLETLKIATKLATARTLNVSGDVTGTAQSFDGSANVSIPTTLATVATAGTKGESAAKTLSFGGTFVVPQITIDAKGRTTSVTERTMTMPAAPSSTSLSNSTPSSPSSSGSAGSGSSASRYDHSHPMQTVINTVTNQAGGNAIKLWAGSASSLPSSRSSDTIYFTY
jgi:hypothetical protein